MAYGSVRPALASRRALGSGTASVLLAACLFVLLQRLAESAWPLAGADLRLVAAAAALFTLSLFLRISGWRYLFGQRERPDRAACVASATVAAFTSPVAPAKLDYAVKIWLLRRLTSRRLTIETIVISIGALGLLDAAALIAPAATGAATVSRLSLRLPLIAVLVSGLFSVAVFLAAGQLDRMPLVRRHPRLRRLTAGLGAVTGDRAGLRAWLLLTGSLWVRAAGLMLLLAALGVSFSITTALVYVCLTAGSGFIPLPSVGLGAGTAALGGLGVGVARAANFALAAGILSLTASALLGLSACGCYTARRLGSRRRRTGTIRA